MALRKTAAQVDSQMDGFRRDHAVRETWAATERILVSVGPSPLSVRVVRSARRLHRPGELAFRFEQITLPDGESEPVTAVLAGLDNFAPPNTRVDAEGHLRGTRAFSWKGLAGGFGAWSAFAGVKYAVASTAALSSFLPATGAGVLGFELLWPRGNDVHVPPQTRCRIRLSYPVTVRVPW